MRWPGKLEHGSGVGRSSFDCGAVEVSGTVQNHPTPRINAISTAGKGTKAIEYRLAPSVSRRAERVHRAVVVGPATVGRAIQITLMIEDKLSSRCSSITECCEAPQHFFCCLPEGKAA